MAKKVFIDTDSRLLNKGRRSHLFAIAQHFMFSWGIIDTYFVAPDELFTHDIFSRFKKNIYIITKPDEFVVNLDELVLLKSRFLATCYIDIAEANLINDEMRCRNIWVFLFAKGLTQRTVDFFGSNRVSLEREYKIVTLSKRSFFSKIIINTLLWLCFLGHEKKYKKIALVVLAIFLTFCSAESALRMIHYPFQSCEVVPDAFETTFDPIVGWKYRSSQTYTKSFGGQYNINAEGYRAENMYVKTDFSKPIILVVGDSFLFGHGLNFEETFGYKLEEKLNHKYEVINFSAQGYGTDQIYLLTRQLLEKYRPVAVVTNYIQDHDVRNISQDRRQIYPCLTYPATKPAFRLVANRLEQAYWPQTYREYDRLKVLVFFRNLMQGDIKKKSIDEGNNLSSALLDLMRLEVEKKGVSFYLLTYDADETIVENKDTRVLGIHTDKDVSKWRIPADLSHPNSKANDMVVANFLDKFGSDFKN